jgi:hypothetical protein
VHPKPAAGALALQIFNRKNFNFLAVKTPNYTIFLPLAAKNTQKTSINW